MTAPSVVRYERHGNIVRITLRNLTNHELREVLVGLWARLDDADKRDHIRELTHDLEPESWLSPVAQAIAEGPDGENVVNLLGLMEKAARRRRLAAPPREETGDARG